MKQQLYIDGRWVDGGERHEILNKYTGEPIGSLPHARPADIDRAIEAAGRAARVMADMPAHRRAEILAATARGLSARADALARVIVQEAGKGLKYARGEVDRAVSTFTLAAEEAKRIHGETIPLDAVPAGEHHFGFWTRRPLGVIGAITPFNFPLNLVAHKVAPALAAGNAVVLKPAELTPLAAVMLCEVLEEAGLPGGAINLVHGPGEEVGEPIVRDRRVAKITFTGSRAVGQRILQVAGIKKVTLELGNTAPVVVCDDADLAAAAKRAALGAYYYSGQVCISVQRVYATPSVQEEFSARFLDATREIGVGDPMLETTDVGPMISEQQAVRIDEWVKEAQGQGARVLAGGTREGALYQPTVLTEVDHGMKVVKDEAFGPVCSLMVADSFEQALARADDTDNGLQAAVFTRDIDRVFAAMKALNFGGLVINDTPSFRADHMPYGGNRQSGLGREGLRFAIEDMTNIQMVSIRLGG